MVSFPYLIPNNYTYSTVTDFKETTQTPFLTFTYHFKIDKKGQMIGGEYEDFDIGFVERY